MAYRRRFRRKRLFKRRGYVGRRKRKLRRRIGYRM